MCVTESSSIGEGGIRKMTSLNTIICQSVHFYVMKWVKSTPLSTVVGQMRGLIIEARRRLPQVAAAVSKMC